MTLEGHIICVLATKTGLSVFTPWILKKKFFFFNLFCHHLLPLSPGGLALGLNRGTRLGGSRGEGRSGIVTSGFQARQEGMRALLALSALEEHPGSRTQPRLLTSQGPPPSSAGLALSLSVFRPTVTSLCAV